MAIRMGSAAATFPLDARIVRVAGDYAAPRKHRSYKRPAAHEEAMRILEKGDGRIFPQQLDADVIRAALASSEQIFEAHLGAVWWKRGSPSRGSAWRDCSAKPPEKAASPFAPRTKDKQKAQPNWRSSGAGISRRRTRRDGEPRQLVARDDAMRGVRRRGAAVDEIATAGAQIDARSARGQPFRQSTVNQHGLQRRSPLRVRGQ